MSNVLALQQKRSQLSLDILLSEIPAGCQLAFEYGDPQTVKDKLEKKFLLTGLFPSSALKNDTPAQIVDRPMPFWISCCSDRIAIAVSTARLTAPT